MKGGKVLSANPVTPKVEKPREESKYAGYVMAIMGKKDGSLQRRETVYDTKGRKLKKGDKVYFNDILAAEDVMVKIILDSYEDEPLIMLKANTKIRLQKKERRPRGIIHILGRIFFNSRGKDHRGFRNVTSNAIIGCGGTMFDVEYNKQLNTTTVNLYEGKVSFECKDGDMPPLTVLPGMTATIEGDCKINMQKTEPEPSKDNFGAPLWTYEDFNINPISTEPVKIAAPAAGDDGTIYVSSYDRVGNWHNAKIHAINPDGTFKWASPELESASVTAPAVDENGTIYVISHYTLYAINSMDGSFLWTWEVPDNLHFQISQLTLGDDGKIFCATVGSGAYHRQIFAINSDGRKLWQHEVTSKISGLTVGKEGTLFAYWNPKGNGHIFALNPESGNKIWSTDIEGYVNNRSSMAIAPDGHLVVSQSGPEKLLKLNAQNGEFIWQVDAPASYPAISPDGHIYLMVGNLYSFNPDGSLDWKADNNTSSSPKRISIDAEGKINVGVFDHYGRGNFEVYYPDETRRYALAKKDELLRSIGPKQCYLFYSQRSKNRDSLCSSGGSAHSSQRMARI